MKLGEEVPDEQLNAVIDSLRANECCTLIYTSGTTGNSKGCMLSHDNVRYPDNILSFILACIIFMYDFFFGLILREGMDI